MTQTKTILILGTLLAGVVYLFAAAECTHTEATIERGGEWDCRTCKADGWHQTEPVHSNCRSYKTEVIRGWCKCLKNTNCLQEGTATNTIWYQRDGIRCEEGECVGQPETWQENLSALNEHTNGGCGS